jgi:hypothetical protein
MRTRFGNGLDIQNGKNPEVWSKIFALLIALFVISPLLFAQGSPKVTSVDPAAGKVNDTVTISGENLGKGSVSAVFLSDDKNDSKASVVEQAQGKISIKIPQVKPGSYNISVQAGDKIMILPVRFEVQ